MASGWPPADAARRSRTADPWPFVRQPLRIGFLRSRTRPATALILRYIDEHVGERHDDGLRWGVESICAALTELGAKIAPATYHEHRGRQPTAREQRDEELKPKIAEVHAANYGVYGARKVWLTLNRQRPADAPPIARCTVERLMGELGLAGAVRGKVKRTTISDPKTPKPLDLVDRNFRPLAPDRLWVADFTYCSTWSGCATPRSSSTPTPDGFWVGRWRPR